MIKNFLCFDIYMFGHIFLTSSNNIPIVIMTNYYKSNFGLFNNRIGSGWKEGKCN